MPSAVFSSPPHLEVHLLDSYGKRRQKEAATSSCPTARPRTGSATDRSAGSARAKILVAGSIGRMSIELTSSRRRRKPATARRRSEEHTSELQSRQYLVCRLLLEKKKNQNR